MPKGVYKHLPRSEETKNKIRDSLCGKPRPVEVCAKISATNKGRKPWNTGKKRPPFSDEHRRKISLARVGRPPGNKGKKMPSIRGKNHWNWQGGKPRRPDKIIRQSLEYRLWRTAVFERDGYTCVFCQHKGGIINADHIKPFSMFPELRFAIDNGRTLCLECHKKTDTFGSKSIKNKKH